ncbi:MAG: lactoylglutathione lyase [Bacteroidetes bacterium]|nr:lactoylglutathione lyase [Bacteroidota bacterium]MBU1720131.1 lactoylglutathione lyase [Bacteroidota bacterium]
MPQPQFEIILYVADQQKSRDFYTAILQQQPDLDVPGMTEFILQTGLKLGLMPENGIAKILGNKTPHPASGNGIPRCELYILSENPEETHQIALMSGAKEISPIQPRDWGHRVGYVADFDGHVIAFASCLDSACLDSARQP